MVVRPSTFKTFRRQALSLNFFEQTLHVRSNERTVLFQHDYNASWQIFTFFFSRRKIPIFCRNVPFSNLNAFYETVPLNDQY